MNYLKVAAFLLGSFFIGYTNEKIKGDVTTVHRVILMLICIAGVYFISINLDNPIKYYRNRNKKK